MAHIEVYSSPWCPYCWMARLQLRRLGVRYQRIPIRMILGIKLPTRALRQMVERTGGDATIPQIFVDGRYLGTEEHLQALASAGQLEDIVAGRCPPPAVTADEES